ncbi:MAG: hypothetical protein ACTHMI_04615 [Mucilaginibacter sp.]
MRRRITPHRLFRRWGTPLSFNYCGGALEAGASGAQVDGMYEGKDDVQKE